MKKGKKSRMLCWLGTILLAMAFVGGTAVDQGEAQALKEVSMTSYGVGTQAYVFSAGIAEAVEKVAGIKTRVIPAGNDISRMMPMRMGEVNFSIATGGTGWMVSHGMFDFAAATWGPQPLRMAWRGGNLFVGFYTRANAGIKNLSELKGKRVAQVPGSPTINNIIKGGIAFGGLTMNDVKVASFPSHGGAGKALTEGAIDMYQFGTTGSSPVETASSPGGIYWFDLDPKNEAAWSRLLEYCPWAAKGLATRYAGQEKGIKPFHALAYPYNIWTWDKIPADLVYAYAKAIWDGYDIYKSKHPELPFWDHKALVDSTGCFYPYHEGLVRLLKEKGAWTAQLDKFQKEQLANEAKRMALWEKSKKEAAAKNIKIGSDEWKDYWWNQVKANGLLR